MLRGLSSRKRGRVVWSSLRVLVRPDVTGLGPGRPSASAAVEMEFHRGPQGLSDLKMQIHKQGCQFIDVQHLLLGHPNPRVESGLGDLGRCGISP